MKDTPHDKIEVRILAEIKAPPPFIFHCHNDIGKWYCELCPNYKTCKMKKQ